jgi:hypothetical protein
VLVVSRGGRFELLIAGRVEGERRRAARTDGGDRLIGRIEGGSGDASGLVLHQAVAHRVIGVGGPDERFSLMSW